MLYAFSLTNSLNWIIWRLKNVDCCYSVWGNNINSYLNMLLHDQPKYVLGMGIYTGVDQNLIRIETKTTNQFRNNPIETGENIPRTLAINYFLKPQPNIAKLANGIGNSWCNLVSWKLMRLINDKQLNSKYTFLHVPQQIPGYQKLNLIDALLKQIY